MLFFSKTLCKLLQIYFRFETNIFLLQLNLLVLYIKGIEDIFANSKDLEKKTHLGHIFKKKKTLEDEMQNTENSLK